MPIAKYRRPLQIAALGLTALLALGLSGVLSPRPAPRYTVTDLGVLTGYAESSADAINSRGDVAVTVGASGFHSAQACVYRQGRLTSLGALPNAGGSTAHDINAAGDVTGVTTLPTGRRAFLYSGGRMRDLGTLPGFQDSAGAGINDRGEVAVNATSSPMQPGSAQGQVFLYTRGRMTPVVMPPGCAESRARGINAAGQVVGDGHWPARLAGRRGLFLYDGRTGAATILPVPAPYGRGGADHINDSGQVIGDVSLPNGNCHAALWHGTHMTDLGTAPGYATSIGVGLNNRGEAVGESFENGSLKTFLRGHAGANNPLRRFLDRDMEHAFVYSGGKMRDLNGLIPRDTDWTLEHAAAINDQGQIVGQGLHHGQERAFLLTPLR